MKKEWYVVNTVSGYEYKVKEKLEMMIKNSSEIQEKIFRVIVPEQTIVEYKDGVKNCLREDCDILVIGEIRDRETMDAAIETAEAGHLVIGTLHTKSCAETIDRMINFYPISDQSSVKYLISSLLKTEIPAES